MPELKNETLAQEQRRIKPALEDIIASRAIMDGDTKQVAFAFLDYCNAKNITYKWSSTNRWNLSIKGRNLGYIGIGIRESDDGTWSILLNHREIVQYEDFIQKVGLSEIIYSNLRFCEGCNGHGDCMSCGQKLVLINPDAIILEYIMKILDFILALSHGTASRPIFDPLTDGLTRFDNKSCVSDVSDFQGNINKNMDNLFDGKYNNYCVIGHYDGMLIGESHDIVFRLDKPVELKMYSLVTAQRIDVPKKWLLYGAESKNEAWSLLDTQDVFPKPVTLYTEKAFKINDPKTYQYYRIILEGRQFILSQLHLYI